MRKFSLSLICFLLLVSAAACGAPDSGADETSSASPKTSPAAAESSAVSQVATEMPKNASSVKWELSGYATFNEKDPESTAGTEDFLQIGNAAEGKNVFAFVRIDLGADWLADELIDAKLFMKPKDTDLPQRLQIRLVTGGWDPSFTPRSEAKTLIDQNNVTVNVSEEDGGWVSVPLTAEVKTWLSGGVQNNGVAIFGVTDGAVYTFAADEANAPYIQASGAVSDRALTYGKFGYKEMKTDSSKSGEVVGNCLSYSLRDESVIEGEHLKGDEKKMEQMYKKGGLDALTDYHVQLVTDYVEAHKSELKISRFRQIENFDSEIDPVTEYRIAMRMGADPIDGKVDFKNPSAMDYHFWLQLNDGRWAQKFPTGDSQIVPCTGPDISPGKFPWHSSYFWTPKSRDYYTGKTIYFAVTKDTDEFTRHRK